MVCTLHWCLLLTVTKYNYSDQTKKREQSKRKIHFLSLFRAFYPVRNDAEVSVDIKREATFHQTPNRHECLCTYGGCYLNNTGLEATITPVENDQPLLHNTVLKTVNWKWFATWFASGLCMENSLLQKFAPGLYMENSLLQRFVSRLYMGN